MAKKKSSKKSSRARRVGAALFGGYKGTALATVSGGAGYYFSMFAAQHSQTVRDRWYLLPAALVASGHFAKKTRKLAGPGVAACVLGGYQLAQNFAFYRQRQAQQPAAAEMSAAAATPQLTAEETAMLMSAAERNAGVSDSAMLVGRPRSR